MVNLLDVSNPEAPAIAEQLPLLTSSDAFEFQATKAVFDQRGLAYVVGGKHGFSIVEPRTLTLIGRFNSATNALYPPDLTDIAVQDDKAYLIDINGFSIVDVSDGAQPELLGHMDLPVEESIGNVAINGALAYVATGAILRIVDVSDPTTPTVLGTFGGFYAVGGIAIRGNHLFMAAQTDWLSPYYLFILDVSDPAAPILLAQTSGCALSDSSLERLAVSADGNLAYMAGMSCSQVEIYDTTVKTNPVIVGAYTLPDEFTNTAINVALNGNRMYVEHGIGIDLVDISDSTAPFQLTRYEPIASSAARISRSPSGLLMFFSYRQEGMTVFLEDAIFAAGFE